jgi:hypothetical protein
MAKAVALKAMAVLTKAESTAAGMKASIHGDVDSVAAATEELKARLYANAAAAELILQISHPKYGRPHTTMHKHGTCTNMYPVSTYLDQHHHCIPLSSPLTPPPLHPPLTRLHPHAVPVVHCRMMVMGARLVVLGEPLLVLMLKRTALL